ncbi:unnamed protein product [Boreogadus saida]
MLRGGTLPLLRPRPHLRCLSGETSHGVRLDPAPISPASQTPPPSPLPLRPRPHLPCLSGETSHGVRLDPAPISPASQVSPHKACLSNHRILHKARVWTVPLRPSRQTLTKRVLSGHRPVSKRLRTDHGEANAVHRSPFGGFHIGVDGSAILHVPFRVEPRVVDQKCVLGRRRTHISPCPFSPARQSGVTEHV